MIDQLIFHLKLKFFRIAENWGHLIFQTNVCGMHMRQTRINVAATFVTRSIIISKEPTSRVDYEIKNKLGYLWIHRLKMKVGSALYY